MPLSDFTTELTQLSPSSSRQTAVRSGKRSIICNGEKLGDLVHYLSGQIPYFYRKPAMIAADFAARHHALEMIADLVVKLPSSPSFQRSHCGEILAALFLEDILGFTRLYCKLSLVTTENSNVHKMDGFFVDLHSTPYMYYAVEAKCSIQPTGNSRFSGHKYGILRQLVCSLDSYTTLDRRFDFSLVRDHLETNNFSAQQQTTIRRDLVPPGPKNFVYLGVASINQSTISTADDDYVLTAPCSAKFQFYSVVVSDLKRIADSSYASVLSMLPKRTS